MTFKILLTGAPCAGKTTVFNMLPRVNGVSYVEEVPRRLLESDVTLMTRRHTLEVQKILLDEQLRVEQEALRLKPELMVCDRGYFDVQAYSRYYGHVLPTDWFEGFERYDVAYLFSIEGVSGEGYYATEKGAAERLGLDSYFNSLIRESGMPFVELAGSPQQRLESLTLSLKERNNYFIEGGVHSRYRRKELE